MNCKLEWATPDLDAKLAYIARISNPQHQDKPIGELFNYMMREGHTSPFDMANICMEINAPRDIARQAIRHSSFKVQEFSQRYQTVDQLGKLTPREFRTQNATNRQLSNDVATDDPRHAEWERRQQRLIALVKDDYEWCLSSGGAKEVARVALPEGLTPSRLYFNGTVRSWIFYVKSRRHKSTQKEHRLIADDALSIMRNVAPVVTEAFFP